VTPDDEYEDTRIDGVNDAHPFTKDTPVAAKQDTAESLPPDTSDEVQPEASDEVAWDSADEMRPETGNEGLRSTNDDGLPSTNDDGLPSTNDEGLRDTRDEVVPLDARDPVAEDAPYASSPGEQAVSVAELGPLFDPANASDFQQRWRSIQSEFVEDPQESVRLAKDLTDEILSSLTLALQDRRQTLDVSAKNGDTEQLRLVLRQYREVLEGVTSL
jgi:hypothetical protein